MVAPEYVLMLPAATNPFHVAHFALNSGVGKSNYTWIVLLIINVIINQSRGYVCVRVSHVCGEWDRITREPNEYSVIHHGLRAVSIASHRKFISLEALHTICSIFVYVYGTRVIQSPSI